MHAWLAENTNSLVRTNRELRGNRTDRGVFHGLLIVLPCPGNGFWWHTSPGQYLGLQMFTHPRFFRPIGFRLCHQHRPFPPLLPNGTATTFVDAHISIILSRTISWPSNGVYNATWLEDKETKFMIQHTPS